MNMSFKEDVSHEIQKLKIELKQLITSKNSGELETNTELYSEFLTNVGKLSGKIDGLELSLIISNRYKSKNKN